MVAALRSSAMAPRVPLHLVGRGASSAPLCFSVVPRLISLYAKQQTSPFTKSQAPRFVPRLSVLEVERKFTPTSASIRQLDQNAGEPPFKSVLQTGVTCFEDTYYDTSDDILSNAGVWIRCRKKFECGRLRFAPNASDPSSPHAVSWEAKIRLGGNFINSAFGEITDMQEIQATLSSLVPGAKLDGQYGPRGGHIRELARFVTNRTSYLVDGKFTVIIDVTDFGHTVGEVELETEASETSCEGAGRTLAIAAMGEEVADLMRRFAWAFPPGTPVGKLSAYFDYRAKQ
ncbi:hypothetical protein KVR01_001154 [Diaporthe batatas]|uniref:uncharacterized protein n=1 Tax=Diaporthe batatas TaxID=748121 RepID=UPI001D04C437|nr:uncharacterized protein KVR01_001154 [Diaporthe batatas]KAG8168405.1 hypothetical protein KVR01_001154 [Diaporthe batatas]